MARGCDLAKGVNVKGQHSRGKQRPSRVSTACIAVSHVTHATHVTHVTRICVYVTADPTFARARKDDNRVDSIVRKPPYRQRLFVCRHIHAAKGEEPALADASHDQWPELEPTTHKPALCFTTG